MGKWLYVSDYVSKEVLVNSNFLLCHSNEGLRLQPPVPSGSQRTVDKGKGTKILGKL
jgi:hypothetical protein